MNFRGPNAFDNLTPTVKALIVSNVTVFLFQIVWPGFFFGYLALRPADVWTHGYVWQVFTYAFLHANGWHLFFNMFSLWMFAPHIEAVWGARRFLGFYAACALGAAALQGFLAPEAAMVGASAPIYGLLYAFAFLFPDAIIQLFFVFPLRAMQAVFFIGALTFVSVLGDGVSRTAHFAHLGGLLTGFVILNGAGVLERVRRSWNAPRARRRFKVVHPDPEQPTLDEEVDRILDKISSEGISSLTDKERRLMDEYARRKK